MIGFYFWLNFNQSTSCMAHYKIWPPNVMTSASSILQQGRAVPWLTVLTSARCQLCCALIGCGTEETLCH